LPQIALGKSSAKPNRQVFGKACDDNFPVWMSGSVS
jgi:hypothetical protein